MYLVPGENKDHCEKPWSYPGCPTTSTSVFLSFRISSLITRCAHLIMIVVSAQVKMFMSKMLKLYKFGPIKHLLNLCFSQILMCVLDKKNY